MKMNKWVIASIIVLFSLGGFYFGPKLMKNFETEKYKKVKIGRGKIAVTILATGTVQPENRLEIKPPVAGRIDKVLVVEGQQVKKGQILAWMSSTERAALIDSARAQGAAEVGKWEEIYKPTPIMAPISGMIILKNVESGQTFTTNDAVLVMSNRLTVKAQVDETDLAQIKKLQKCEVRLDSYPDEKIDGTVGLIAYEAKTVSNVTTYTVEIYPEVTPAYMRSGMTANVTFFIKTKEDIPIIPAEFIKYENGKPMASVEKANGKITDTEISLGVSDGKQSEILDGISEGDTVTLQILNKNTKGKSTNPFNPMSNRPRASGKK